MFRADNITLEERIAFVPVYVNGGLLGYTDTPYELSGVIKLFKRTGCLPYSVSVVFSIRERSIQIYMDAGRPLRPLIWLEPGKANVKDRRMALAPRRSSRATRGGALPLLGLGHGCSKCAAGKNIELKIVL